MQGISAERNVSILHRELFNKWLSDSAFH